MADPRHAPDTLFLFVEEDWRLFANHCVARPELLAAEAAAEYAAANPGSASTFQQRPREMPVGLAVDELFQHRLQGTPLSGRGDEMLVGGERAEGWRNLVGT